MSEQLAGATTPRYSRDSNEGSRIRSTTSEPNARSRAAPRRAVRSLTPPPPDSYGAARVDGVPWTCRLTGEVASRDLTAARRSDARGLITQRLVDGHRSPRQQRMKDTPSGGCGAVHEPTCIERAATPPAIRHMPRPKRARLRTESATLSPRRTRAQHVTAAYRAAAARARTSDARHLRLTTSELCRRRGGIRPSQRTDRTRGGRHERSVRRRWRRQPPLTNRVERGARPEARAAHRLPSSCETRRRAIATFPESVEPKCWL
jgi:hypothetical protein